MPNPIEQFFGGTISQPYNPPQEYGVDVALPVGKVVDLPREGLYQPQLSTTYSSVFRLVDNSGYEDVVHISPLAFGNNQDVVAGTPIGTVSPIYNTSAPYSVGTFPNIVSGEPVGPFTSSGPHIELGYYVDPTEAQNASGRSSINPLNLFSSAQSTPQKCSGFYDTNGQWVCDDNPIKDWINHNIFSHLPSWLQPAPPSAQPPSQQTPQKPSNICIPLTSYCFPADIGFRLTVVAVALIFILVGGMILAGKR